MSILVFALIVIVIMALAIYGFGLLPFDAWLIRLLQVVAVAIAIVAIAQKAGMV